MGMKCFNKLPQEFKFTGDKEILSRIKGSFVGQSSPWSRQISTRQSHDCTMYIAV